jgi:hypothetical protein
LKAYIGTKKVDGKYRYGLTVYSETGAVLHTSIMHDAISENKFENGLKSIDWATKKIKTLTQNKSLDDQESIVMIIASKTIYGWFQKDVAPEPYTVLLSDIFLELSFFTNSLEIIFSQNGEKRVLYRNSNDDKAIRVTDLLK